MTNTETLKQNSIAEAFNNMNIGENLKDFEAGLDGKETEKFTTMINLQDTTEKLNLNVEDPNTTVELKEIKWTRPMLETIVSIDGESLSNTDFIKFLAEKWNFNHKLEEDPNTREGTIRFPKQDVIMIKGKEVKITIKHILYVPEKIKFQDISNKAYENKLANASNVVRDRSEEALNPEKAKVMRSERLNTSIKDWPTEDGFNTLPDGRKLPRAIATDINDHVNKGFLTKDEARDLVNQFADKWAAAQKEFWSKIK